MTSKSLKVLILCSCSFFLLHPQNVRHHLMDNVNYPKLNISNEREVERFKLKIQLWALDIGIIEREINKELDKK